MRCSLESIVHKENKVNEENVDMLIKKLEPALAKIGETGEYAWESALYECVMHG